MKTQNKTWIQMEQEIFEMENRLQSLKADQRNNPSDSFMKVVVGNSGFFDNQTQLLVEEINNRDEPMTFATIKAIFESSGLAFTENDVFACHPDSQEAVNDQIRYYRE